jgi:hypothetical protein
MAKCGNSGPGYRSAHPGYALRKAGLKGCRGDSASQRLQLRHGAFNWNSGRRTDTFAVA